ncbi:MAG: aminopeptidase P family protein [Acidimicrobiaceae bacterium]|nr:aminopeptidase P family protein [Acidimicrobiaceae bacterium]
MSIPSADVALDGPLPAMDVAGRIDRLRAAMLAEPEDVEGDGVSPLEALVVTSLTNIRYLTGFAGSAGLLFVLGERNVLVTDGRYAEQSVEQIAAAGADVTVEVAPAARQAEVCAGLVRGAGAARVGLEAAHVSWARQQAMATKWFPGVELVATLGLVEGLRRAKDAGELARVARAAAIADRALASVVDQLEEGPTEAAFGLALDTEMRRLGAAGPSFETIVASGPNAAKPHHRPSGRRIGAGEPVVLDFGALCDGYCSDITRTVWVGELADPELAEVVRVVTEAQAAGVAAVADGVACAEVDRVCREVIGSAGWGEQFVHGTGHGVGLDIHEAPSVAATSTDTLAIGHVVTVEPGVYLPGRGGVRVEDTVAVTATGRTPLTNAPKEHR